MRILIGDIFIQRLKILPRIIPAPEAGHILFTSYDREMLLFSYLDSLKIYFFSNTEMAVLESVIRTSQSPVCK